MAASVTVLWLVAAFLGGAFSLTCYQCNSTIGANCEDNPMLCDTAYDTCITTLTEIRGQDKSTQQKPYTHVVKSCGEKKSCNDTYSMTFNLTKISTATACCQSDKCKTVIPEVKPQEKENQLKCPYCSGLTTKCIDSDRVSCVGEEKKCVSFTAKDASVPNTVYTWKGCASEKVCTMKAAVLPMNQILASLFQCNQAASLLPGLFLPAALGLVSLKLLL